MRSTFLALLLTASSACSIDRTGLAQEDAATDRDAGRTDAGHDAGRDAGPTDAGPDADAGSDLCPDDPDKTEPGVCGCGTPDDDSDSDGTPDCEDGCPFDPMKFDPGVCGCGDPDLDSDSDGFLACEDCDDDDRDVNPGADEHCNERDDDCDMMTDEGGVCDIGCADGEREAFLDPVTRPDIAGCSGAWSERGILDDVAPACAREGGDDGPRPMGSGCNIEDLCAFGWHVCEDPAEVAASSPTGCTGALEGTSGDLFFLQRQSGTGNRECDGGQNDIFGCGNLGDMPKPSCRPLDAVATSTCSALPPTWDCGASNFSEAAAVTKDGGAGGGVLCCRD